MKKFNKAELMVKQIGKGIKMDTAEFEGGSPEKVLYDPDHIRDTTDLHQFHIISPLKMLHDPAQYDAVKAAGFQSVRFFVGGDDPSIYEPKIQDALDRNLAVVICLWGHGRWVSNPVEGKEDFVTLWDRFARYYKDYPDTLVFEFWNEPICRRVSAYW